MSQLHYLPLSPVFFTTLTGLFILLVVLIQVGILRYVYTRLGVSSRVALLLLFASLVGSYLNIPVSELPEQHILSGQEINFFGVRHMVPVMVDWPGTVIAVNVGGALIPTLVSLYLLARYRLWTLGILCTACVAALCHWLAQPVLGLGIALPTFVPAMFTGADGRSHVEDTKIALGVTQAAKAVHFEETPAGSALDWHTAPHLQYVVTLSGTLEFTTRDGETFVLHPGDVLLAADTSGTGLRWRLFDDEPWRRLYVELPVLPKV